MSTNKSTIESKRDYIESVANKYKNKEGFLCIYISTLFKLLLTFNDTDQFGNTSALGKTQYNKLFVIDLKQNLHDQIDTFLNSP